MTSSALFIQRILALSNRVAFVTCFCVGGIGASSSGHAMDLSNDSWKSVSGSGKFKTESRPASGFSGISLSLPGVVEIHQGSREGVTVEADDNIMPLIETVVEKGTLQIRPAGRNISFRANKMNFNVYVKVVDKLAISGSGDMHAKVIKASALGASIDGSGSIRIKSLDADALTVSIDGSGDFAVTGRSRSLDARIDGSGDIDAGNLYSGKVDVGIAGSGDVTVWAGDTLNVTLAGSGDVSYFGNPKVRKSISGSGSINRLGAK